MDDSSTLQDGPLLNGHRLRYNEQMGLLIIDDLLIRLTTVEYLLVMALLHQRAQFQTAGDHHEPFVRFARLQHCAGLNRHSLLVKHLSNAAGKLWAAGIFIARVDGYGYMLVFEPAEESHPKHEALP